MIRSMGLFAVNALGLALTDAPGADPPPASTKGAKLLRKKLEAARTAFKEVWPGQWGDVEIPYRWSYRWLKVERELSAKTEDRVIKGLSRQRLTGLDQVRAAEFYVAEAEAWLAQAKE